MKELGEIQYALGIKVERSENEIQLHQELYIKDILTRSEITPMHPALSPMMTGEKLTMRVEGESRCDKSFNFRSHVGSIMYAATCSRPDIGYAVNQVSRFLADPSESHMDTVIRIYRYLAKTSNLALCYKYNGDKKDDESVRMGAIDLRVYVDAEYSTDPSEPRSCTGYVLCLAGGPIAWKSKKQKTAVLSSTEAEYVALSEVTKETLYVTRLMEELGFPVPLPVRIFEDNTSTIAIAENPVCHERTKHIHPRYHFIR